MADLSELKVQMTLTLGEMKDLVTLLAFADEELIKAGQEHSELVEEIATMYFNTMEQLNDDGFLEGFDPE